MKNIDDIIERFNNRDYSVLDYFGGDYQTFFKFLERRGKLTEVDPTGTDSDEYQNELLLYFYRTDKNKFYYWCNELLSDVEFVDGKPFIVSDAESFAILFCDSRDVSRETIEKILSGEQDFDWYDEWDIDVYDFVIHELDFENLKELKDIFLRDLGGKEITIDDEDITITPQNIDQIFRDGKLVNKILSEELDNLEYELKNLYHNAERQALEDDYYEEVWSELNEFFYTENRNWVTVKRGFTWDKEGNRKDKYREEIRMPIKDFDTYVTDYLEGNKKYSMGTLEYHGNYIELLKDGGDCLRVRLPDYADSRKTEKNINDMFGDYIS